MFPVVRSWDMQRALKQRAVVIYVATLYKTTENLLGRDGSTS